MRGGITCVKCNKSLKSLKYFQPVNDRYRCPSCGFIGKIFAGNDKLLYLVENEQEIPLVPVRMDQRKDPSEAISNKAKKPVEYRDEKREKTISRIIHLVDIMNIKEFSGWDDVDFRNITRLREQKQYLTEELCILLENLERVYEKRMAAPQKDDDLLALDPSEKNWRLFIPEAIKTSFDDWHRVSSGIIELFAKDRVKSARGKDKKEIQEFLEYVSKLPNEQKADVFWDLEEENKSLAHEDDDSLFDDEVDFEEPLLDEWRKLAPEQVREYVDGWKTLSVSNMQQEVLDLIALTKSRAARTELEDYLGILDDLLLFGEEDLDDDTGEDATYDPLAVIEKYKDGAIPVVKTTAFKIDDSWRKMIPSSLKYQIKDWKTISIQEIYSQAKGIMEQSRGTSRQELMPFVVELSQIIFDRDHDAEDDEVELEDNSFSRDEASEAVMNLVEMIILPHLEVMDIIQNKGGNITFSNLWYKPFTEKLKEEVLDRDEWRCVICEAETDLHVHHKIPREKGGIHHKHNLVTLCASCHGAVETADVQRAFKKCLANYNRKKFSHINRETLSMDKKLLREEVESKLDALLHELNKRDEPQLMQEVVGVMKRLEIIFYD